MNNLKTVLLTFLNNQNYIDALSMVVVAITSYQVAKYTASRPNK